MEEFEAREASPCHGRGLKRTASWRRAGAIARGRAALPPAGFTVCGPARLLPLLAFRAGFVAGLSVAVWALLKLVKWLVWKLSVEVWPRLHVESLGA